MDCGLISLTLNGDVLWHVLQITHFHLDSPLFKIVLTPAPGYYNCAIIDRLGFGDRACRHPLSLNEVRAIAHNSSDRVINVNSPVT